MTAYEYMNALREALGVLPEEERANAIRYYEEYFLDAGPENEARVIEELGAPEQVAQQILNDYKEIVRAAPRSEPGAEAGPEPIFGEAEEAPRPRRSPLVSFLALCGALFLGVTIGIPLLASGVAAIFSLVVAVLTLIGVILLAGVLLFAVLPLALLLAGFLLCVFSLFLWTMPASALVTLGVGLCLFAIGILLGAGCMRLGAAAFRPLLRAGGWCIEQLGRLLRLVAGAISRFIDRLKGV